jgi:phosphoglycolate phosphatase-like HAD superfamily hydrolase
VHVVWDWNGTLLDDFELVVACASASCTAEGGRAVTSDEYRRWFTRPVHLSYERVLGRAVGTDDWSRINDVFHATYRTMIDRAVLAPDARDALELARTRGWSQSLLSMWTHDELVPMVESFGIADYFVRIDGQPVASGGLKEEFLAAHVAVIDTTAPVIVIGDSTDDAIAARAVGVPCILVASGTHHHEDLKGTGAPIAATLLEALDLVGVT